MTATTSRLRSAGLSLAGVAILVALWAALSVPLGPARLPSPVDVVVQFFTSATSNPQIELIGAGPDGFLPHVAATAIRYLIGTASGIGIALVIIGLARRFAGIRAVVIPVVDVIRPIPPLALAPFLLLWFGTGEGPIVGVVVLYVFLMVFVAGVQSIARGPSAPAEFASTLGASRSVVVWRVALPQTLPALAGPIRVASTWAWGLVVVGELLGARTGIGRLMTGFIPLTATNLVIVGIIWVLLLALVSELILSIVLSRLTRWNA